MKNIGNKILKFFSYTCRVLDVPYLDTKELSKIIEENLGNKELIEKKILEVSKVNNKEFKKHKLPVIAVLTFEGENDIKKSSDIVKDAVETFGVNPTSVLPSDYSIGSKFQPESNWFLEKTGVRGEYKLSNLGKKIFKEINS